MSRSRISSGGMTITRSITPCVLLTALLGLVTLRGAENVLQAQAQTQGQTPLPPAAADDGAIPQPLNGDTFAPLAKSSPFTRSLGISDTVILTGIAHLENDVFATLLDTQTMQSQVVSSTANFQGWQLVGVGGDPAKIQTWTAQIQVEGGEVISIRYQKPPAKLNRPDSGGSSSSSRSSPGGSGPPLSSSQMAEAKKAALNPGEEFSGDGYPRKPPAEVVAKLSRLSVGQREDINRQMLGLRNQGLSLDQRRKIYDETVNRAVQGRR